MKKLNKAYDPKIVEDRTYRLWEKSGYFNPDKLPVKAKGEKRKVKSFCIVVPPPNITGTLHMGHALNAVIQDILIRKKRMEGYKTLWLPGTDHAGIATQNVVEKEFKKQGLTRHQLGREKFLQKVWEWKEKYGHIILDQFKKLGSSMDWSRTRFTMDPDYQKAVQVAFLHYYNKKGWIYQAERVISWCSRCGTSLSDLELEHKEEKTNLYYINYPLADKSDFITVATTRPETMLGDAAVAVNPKDSRYKKLIGKEAILPIQNRKIPIIADKAVDISFGTGAVKVTPAHDLLDAEIGERHKLNFYKVIGPDGKMTNEAGQDFKGQTILVCRQQIIDELKKLNLIQKTEPYQHNIAVCYRCGTVIESIPSQQWFLKMGELAKIAIKAVKSGKIKFFPRRWEKIYFDWLNNIKDWCISRQIWWGHQLPVFYCRKKLEEFKILRRGQRRIRLWRKNSKFKINEEYLIVSEKKPKKCSICGICEMKQSEDVLDTWFSSALWPFATLGWPKQTKDLKGFYPTAVLSTARDIINLWVTRMVFSGLEFTKKEPFKDVVIHATVLTKEGRRMSKSLGTGVDPMDLISCYGADATRFGLIWQAMGNQDIHWSEEHIVAGRKFCNKIWNATRFILMNKPPQINTDSIRGLAQIKKITLADKKIVSQLKKTKKAVEKDLENYQFGQALHKIYRFFWHQFCDIYIERSKKQLVIDNIKLTTQNLLLHTLFESLKLLHPFIPFITEEIYQNLPLKDKKLLMVE